MEKKVKYLIIALIGISSFTLLLLFNFNILPGLDFWQNTENEDTEINPKDTVSNISLTVDYNNGTKKIKKNFTLTDGKITVFDALVKWCEVEYDEYDSSGFYNDYFVTSIDGKGEGWTYYVNEEYVGIASNKYDLSNGDTIEWRFVGS